MSDRVATKILKISAKLCFRNHWTLNVNLPIIAYHDFLIYEIVRFQIWLSILETQLDYGYSVKALVQAVSQ
jgi:hypothetical protein